MHIVHLSTRRDFYGAEVCLANLADGLAARGHRVSCLVQPDSVLADRLAAAPGVRVVPVPMLDWFDPGTIRRVGGWLRRQAVDILATHLPRDYFIAAVASRGVPLANVATRHMLAPLTWPWLKRPFLARFQALIAVSEAVATGVRQARLVPGERLFTVPNGVAAPRPAGGGGLRLALGLPRETFVVGMVGQLGPHKGTDLLIEALARISARTAAVHLLLIGDDADPAYRARLADRCGALGLADRVHFCGYVQEAAAHCGEFDVQVVASPAEPFGLATIEAMAAGVPVIATDSGGSPEIVRDGVEGFLVRPGDVEGLANRLVCLLESPGLRRQMGRRGRERHRQRFTVERMVTATADVYADALARARA